MLKIKKTFVAEQGGLFFFTADHLFAPKSLADLYLKKRKRLYIAIIC